MEVGLLAADGLAEPPPQGFGKGDVFSEPRCGLLAAGVVFPKQKITKIIGYQALFALVSKLFTLPDLMPARSSSFW